MDRLPQAPIRPVASFPHRYRDRSARGGRQSGNTAERNNEGQLDALPGHLKPRCCPRAPARKISRSVYEGARDLAREIAKTEAYQMSRRQRKKVEMLFAHLKRILKLDRLRLRGPNGARDEFHLAATAQNLRKLAILVPTVSPMPAG